MLRNSYAGTRTFVVTNTSISKRPIMYVRTYIEYNVRNNILYIMPTYLPTYLPKYKYMYVATILKIVMDAGIL